MRQYANLFYDTAIEVARRDPGNPAAKKLFLLAYSACKEAKPKHMGRLMDIVHSFGGETYLFEFETLFSSHFIRSSLERLNEGLALIPEEVSFIHIRNDIIAGMTKATLAGNFLETSLA